MNTYNNKLPSSIKKISIEDYIHSEGADVSDYFRKELNITDSDIANVYINVEKDCPYFGLELKTRHPDEERDKYRVSCLPVAVPIKKMTFNEMVTALTTF